MIRIRYQNDSSQECTIRPTPLVSISTNLLKNGAGEAFGVTYGITLTGTLIADQGTPYAIDHKGVGVDPYPFYGTPSPTPVHVGPYGTFDNNVSHVLNNKPPRQAINVNEAATAILGKQKALRALFAQDGQRFEITDINEDIPAVICYPRFVSIDFQEGIYVEQCQFTVTLECDTLLYGQDDDDLWVNQEGTLITGSVQVEKNEAELIGSLSGYFINDYSEDWAIEIDESRGESVDIPHSYRITHNLNATGKTHYTPSGTKLSAWEQARDFVHGRMSNNINDYPNVMGLIGSGTLNLIDAYGGFNHVRTEQIGESNGSYSVSENWLIASGTAYENFNMSISSSTDNPFVNVGIDGNIKGLSQISPSGFGSTGTTAYHNALTKYNGITNSGQFGVGSLTYKRANNAVAVQLNSQPKSISLGVNEYNGEVTYNLSFDNRPTNIVSGVLSENININDTYPGDVFAVIPVIGRITGPVLQYVGTRTEYKRDVSVGLVMDYTKIPYASGRNPMLLKKPSVVEPTATQLFELLRELSPSGEPNVRKLFLSAPTESWDPKGGVYNLNLSWIYELSE